ncbi:Karyogamy protein KAR9 [Wickerhamomyces ciferrii]|uniref:Karyogamy protein KAR9 n=1 Tax=Wickerhamomyces ciferrii (strain ATCC 14091 / BCRC 22168 / CBS 111 / JCM 3599 / NBRC 0793 / NRRL Y-1031 F-60-10) TaxID=1206466 RepID=K0KGM6_WICCF|nr:Karyogamy protein KAR9 [Wickerhamomyces ciferrii]CCH40579.1 Karyogamy protein KAR9 [Wickerhamomyces ciferrii]
MVQRLSEILTVRSEFNLFESIANLEPFDLNRLDKVVDEVLSYITDVKGIFQFVSTLPLDLKQNLNWLAEGRNRYYDIHRKIDSIDSLVLQSLNLLEANFEIDEKIADSGIFDKLDVLGEITLEVKQSHFTQFKNEIDVSTEYNEIFNLTMNSINNELESCLKKCFRIHERRFSSPVRHAPNFNLDLLTKKLFKQKSGLRLPLLTEIENQLYEEFLDLKSTVDPLRASLEFIPSKIQEFQEKHKDLDEINIANIRQKYNSLIKELNFLQNEVDDLKFELVDKRWSEIFSYLNTEMSYMIVSVQKETSKLSHLKDSNSSIESQVLKKIKYTTHIVDNTFVVINQAIDEKLIDFATVEKSNGLAERWLEVKESIPDEYLPFLEADDDDDLEELKKFKTLSLDDGNSKREDSDNTPVKNKRRSRAGEFFMGKLNLKPIMIETNPTSAIKQDINDVPKHILSDSHKHNKLDSTPSKPGSSTLDAHSLQKIPELKTALSKETENLIAKNYLASPPSDKSDSKSSMSPIKEVQTPEALKIDSHKYDVFQTPRPSDLNRRRSLQVPSSVSRLPVLSKSKEPTASRIPRPSSRLGAHDRERSLSKDKSQPVESSIQRKLNRPASAMASTRLTQSDRPPSRAGVLNKRHSMIPQTPVRSSYMVKPVERTSSRNSESRRRSLLPQPTPVKEIIERGGSRLGERRSSAEVRTQRFLDRPEKPIWK